MTDKEIIKALECCKASFPKDCSICPMKRTKMCIEIVARNALDLINRQQAEIERLTNYNRCIDAQCRDLLEENERLKEEHDKNFEKWEILDKRTKERYAELYEEAKGVVRTEAIKEFAEKLKEKAKPFLAADILGTDDIDDLIEEMVGAENEH